MTTKMTTPKVRGACGFCGAVKVAPSHKVDEVAPRAVPTCDHTSD